EAIYVAGSWYELRPGTLRLGSMEFTRGATGKTLDVGGTAFSCQTRDGTKLAGPVTAIQLLRER
ncbi:MAG TPA: hypothetical protein VNC22_09485, partial [Sporichthya sp.]|nr:hypothetical protein [Sporichthya sp.]